VVTNHSPWTSLAIAIVALTLTACTPREGPEALEPDTSTGALPASKGWAGRAAEAFALPGVEGEMVDVGRMIGERPVVLVFYRGVW
jgi:hypothetical protein